MANDLVDLLSELHQRGNPALCMPLSAGCKQTCAAHASQLDQFHVLKRADDFESMAKLKPVGVLCRSEIIFSWHTASLLERILICATVTNHLGKLQL